LFVNSFIYILNPNVIQKCPFCSQRETIFYMFMYSTRLKPLFDLDIFMRIFSFVLMNLLLYTFLFLVLIIPKEDNMNAIDKFHYRHSKNVNLCLQKERNWTKRWL